MRNITNKIETLRTARAETLLKIREETLGQIHAGQAPKGDPFPLARAAAVMAAKKTSDLLPYCHPLLLDSVNVDFEFRREVIAVNVEVTAIAKTGVEMEALTASSVAALTLYDMLKPIDKDMEILSTRLLEKRGGKSSFKDRPPADFKAVVIVTSDGVSQGTRENKTGPMIQKQLQEFGAVSPDLRVLPDEKSIIIRELLKFCEQGYHLILTTGGTGLGPRDVTVEATREVMERDLPGIAEAMRAFGQRRTPYAMLSRGLVGVRGKTILVNLPGSSKGVEESLAALLPALFHAYPIAEGGGH